MNKFMIATFIAMSSMALHADAWDCKGLSPAESNLMMRAKIFVENYSPTSRCFITYREATNITNKVFLERLDNNLKSAPPARFVSWVWKDMFPQAHSAALEAVGQEYPEYVALIKKYHGWEELFSYGLTSSEQYIGFRLMWLDVGYIEKKIIDQTISLIKRQAARNVKKQLRKEGKKIVVGADGRNQVQERLDAVSAALDAPRFKGLEVALKSCGVEVHVPAYFRAAYTDEEAKEVMNKVYYGDMAFTEETQIKLRFVLGTDAYNKFVEKYNGGD